MSDTTGLTDEERAELEALRAEKAERERAARAQAERAELERLRAEKAAAEAETTQPAAAPRPEARPAAASSQPPVTEAERAQLARDAAARERGRKLMEPDDDELKMAPGQKIVVAAILIVAVAWGIATFLG